MATDTLHQKPKAIFRRPRPLDIVCDTAGGLMLFLPTSLEGTGAMPSSESATKWLGVYMLEQEHAHLSDPRGQPQRTYRATRRSPRLSSQLTMAISHNILARPTLVKAKADCHENRKGVSREGVGGGVMALSPLPPHWNPEMLKWPPQRGGNL